MKMTKQLQCRSSGDIVPGNRENIIEIIISFFTAGYFKCISHGNIPLPMGRGKKD